MIWARMLAYITGTVVLRKNLVPYALQVSNRDGGGREMHESKLP
jgi:hypothetical protein